MAHLLLVGFFPACHEFRLSNYEDEAERKFLVPNSLVKVSFPSAGFRGASKRAFVFKGLRVTDMHLTWRIVLAGVLLRSMRAIPSNPVL